MTLEEAIQHCEENVCDNSLCSMEHKQLAEWLKELQALKRNNNSIEERAKEHSKGQWDELTAKNAYIAGAIEQKAIDIDKACEWFEGYLAKIGYPDDWCRDSKVQESGEKRFRKAMEE